MFLLLADKNRILPDLIVEYLCSLQENNDVVSCYSCETMLKIAELFNPQLIVVDLTSLDYEEIAKLSELKARDESLTIFVFPASNAQQIDESINKHLWLDDYLIKPFSRKDLEVRLHMIKKRSTEQNYKLQEKIKNSSLEDSSYSSTEVKINSIDKDSRDFIESYYDFNQDERKEFGHYINTDLNGTREEHVVDKNN